MKISDLISALVAERDAHGEINVIVYNAQAGDLEIGSVEYSLDSNPPVVILEVEEE